MRTPEPVNLELEGGRARLEPLAESHAEGLARVFESDPEIFRHYTVRAPVGLAEVRQWIRAALEARDAGSCLAFAVIDRQAESVAGSTRYMEMQPVNRLLEIGSTFYAPTARRTSVNTECKYLLLRHAFEALGCRRVQLKTDVRNEGSRRAIERIGGVFEGVLRQHLIRHDGTFRDSAMYSIVEPEWAGVKQRLAGMLGRAPT